MIKKCIRIFVLSLSVATLGWADEYNVTLLAEKPADETIAADIAAQLSDTGCVVQRGTSRTVCELWLCKQWPVVAAFKSADEVLYPFEPGQLVGVLRLKRKGSEFRDRDLSSGVYTLRYGRQPIDGNHEGTFPTRDFLMLVRAADDQSAGPMDEKKLLELSAKALESPHPALMCLLQAGDEPVKVPSLRHNADDDWWILQLQGKAVTGGQPHELRVDLVVAGYAQE